MSRAEKGWCGIPVTLRGLQLGTLASCYWTNAAGWGKWWGLRVTLPRDLFVREAFYF